MEDIGAYRPKEIKLAVGAILLSLAISLVLSLVNLQRGLEDTLDFGILFVLSAILLIFPYKIWQGSKGWTYGYVAFYIVGSVLSFLMDSEEEMYQATTTETLDHIQFMILTLVSSLLLFFPASRRWLK